MITVIIPGNPPLKEYQRNTKYEIPLDKTLLSKDLGHVSGGGTGVRSCYVDVTIPDGKFSKAVETISKKLRRLKAPEGTRLICGTWSQKVI